MLLFNSLDLDECADGTQRFNVSSVSPLSEEMEELWVLSVYMRNMELPYRWEHGNDTKKKLDDCKISKIN